MRRKQSSSPAAQYYTENPKIIDLPLVRRKYRQGLGGLRQCEHSGRWSVVFFKAENLSTQWIPANIHDNCSGGLISVQKE
jgi:hypothetical protein